MVDKETKKELKKEIVALVVIFFVITIVMLGSVAMFIDPQQPSEQWLKSATRIGFFLKFSALFLLIVLPFLIGAVILAEKNAQKDHGEFLRTIGWHNLTKKEKTEVAKKLHESGVMGS